MSLQDKMPKLNGNILLSTFQERSFSAEFLQTKHDALDTFNTSARLAIVDLILYFNRGQNGRHFLYSILTIALSALVFVFGSYISGEPESLIRGEMWVWLTVLIGTVIYISAAQRIENIFRKYCFNQLNESALKKFTSLLNSVYSRAKKLAVAGLSGIIFGALLTAGFVALYQKFTPVSCLSAIAVSTYIGSWLHGLYSIRLYTQFLDDNEIDVEVYPINPIESIIISKSISIIQIAGVAVVSIVSLFIPLLLIVNGASPLYQYIGIGLIIGSAIAVLAIFFDGHSSLSELILTKKHAILDAIQIEIRLLLSSSTILYDATNKRLDFLISLHDRIASSPSQTINLINFAQATSSILIPVITFSISNFDTFRKLLMP